MITPNEKDNVELLQVSGNEEELGEIARFCHTPIATPHVAKTPREYVNLAVNCYKLGHMSVFEFSHILFRITCPIYVARQLFRHRNGVFMEKSLRYLEAPEPQGERDSNDVYEQHYSQAYAAYRQLIESGVRKEQARAILPLGTPTSFLWLISLRSLFNVFDQRLHPSAQEETRKVVQKMFDLAKQEFPHLLATWEEKR